MNFLGLCFSAINVLAKRVGEMKKTNEGLVPQAFVRWTLPALWSLTPLWCPTLLCDLCLKVADEPERN